MKRHAHCIRYRNLGDPSKTYYVQITEPELNAIGASVGFAHGACKRTGDFLGFWNHYGATLENLSNKLAALDQDAQQNEDTIQ